MSQLMRKCALSLLLCLWVLVGCDAPDVQVVISPEYQSAMIQIDFIRVPRANVPLWKAKDIDEYFSPGDSFREYALARGDVYSIYYNVPQRKFIGQINRGDSVWEQFQFDAGSTDQEFDVVIMADLPGVHGGSPLDIRRQVIPLYKKAWSISFMDKMFGKGLDKLVISITSNGILLDPAPSNYR